ncbi:MAG: flagellar basal body rod protein FlgB [candidate division Zixibacteria bacterium]|nr:flagellar basal body rod protein FlgB [candidate division Zixibacteria bacterium]
MSNKLNSFVFEKMGIPQFQRVLDLTSYRHKLVAGNIANVSTPGYESTDIDFKGELSRLSDKSGHLAGHTTHSSHIPLGRHPDRAPKVETQRVSPDELNSVDIDKEVSNMAQNELLYTIGARLLEKKLSGLKNAITSK